MKVESIQTVHLKIVFYLANPAVRMQCVISRFYRTGFCQCRCYHGQVFIICCQTIQKFYLPVIIVRIYNFLILSTITHKTVSISIFTKLSALAAQTKATTGVRAAGRRGVIDRSVTRLRNNVAYGLVAFANRVRCYPVDVTVIEFPVSFFEMVNQKLYYYF